MSITPENFSRMIRSGLDVGGWVALPHPTDFDPVFDLTEQYTTRDAVIEHGPTWLAHREGADGEPDYYWIGQVCTGKPTEGKKKDGSVYTMHVVHVEGIEKIKNDPEVRRALRRKRLKRLKEVARRKQRRARRRERGGGQ